MLANDSNLLSWGDDLTIICAADFNYLPGAYALFNSAVCNGFKGQFLISCNSNDTYPIKKIVSHPQLGLLEFSPPSINCPYLIKRWFSLENLPDGKYLWLDSDIIIERPIGHYVSAIGKSLLLSTEPEPKYDLYDIHVYQQCQEAGLDFDLTPLSYINGGLLGFSLPEHKTFIKHFLDLLSRLFINRSTESLSPIWFIPEQELLNILARQKQYQPVCTISPRNLELGANYTIFQDRKFPYTKQAGLHPTDQLKYIIHGAAQYRPWLKRAYSWKGKLRQQLQDIGIYGLFNRPSPYERAWAYYACARGMPVDINQWSEEHAFSLHKSPLWQMVYGLDS